MTVVLHSGRYDTGTPDVRQGLSIEKDFTKLNPCNCLLSVFLGFGNTAGFIAALYDPFPALPGPTCGGDWSWPREAAREAHFDS
jgi:hypothetical protein